MRNMVIDLQSSDTWKIHWTIAVNLISLHVHEEEGAICSGGDNIRFTSHNDSDEVIDELFEWLQSRYQENSETTIRGVL